LLEGFVLHRRDYGNSSLLLELFTRASGRFPVVAKGAKRSRRGDAALLQPFRPLWIGVGGRGEVKSLARVEAAAAPTPVSGRALYCGFYLNELILRMLDRADPHEVLYDHYRDALSDLGGGREEAQVLRRFELQLLEQTGYAMVLDREVDGNGPLRSQARYRYEPESGPVECRPGDPGFSVSGATLLALATGAALEGACAREAKELLRRVLAGYLGPQPLKSRELFRKIYPNH
jgi:DNA repair protein RecO (recombination protein O)